MQPSRRVSSTSLGIGCVNQACAGNQYCNLCLVSQWMGGFPLLWWRKTGQSQRGKRCIRRLEARFQALVCHPQASFSPSSPRHHDEVCRTAARGHPLDPCQSVSDLHFCAMAALSGSPLLAVRLVLASESRGNFPWSTQRATNMHSCGRRGQRLVR